MPCTNISPPPRPPSILARAHVHSKRSSKYTKVANLSDIDAALTPVLSNLDKRATPAISKTLKVTDEKIATPLAPIIKYFAKFLPVKTTEKVGSWALEIFLKNLERVQQVMLIKDKATESTPEKSQ